MAAIDWEERIGTKKVKEGENEYEKKDSEVFER